MSFAVNCSDPQGRVTRFVMQMQHEDGTLMQFEGVGYVPALVRLWDDTSEEERVLGCGKEMVVDRFQLELHRTPEGQFAWRWLTEQQIKAQIADRDPGI